MHRLPVIDYGHLSKKVPIVSINNLFDKLQGFSGFTIIVLRFGYQDDI